MGFLSARAISSSRRPVRPECDAEHEFFPGSDLIWGGRQRASGENHMNRTTCAFTAIALSVSFAQLASGGQSGTAAEAKAMLERAVTALKVNEAAALRQFNDRRDSRFHDRDLYVFCSNLFRWKNDGTPKPRSDRHGYPCHQWRFADAKDQRLLRTFRSEGSPQ
jgi:hypothetical protein